LKSSHFSRNIRRNLAQYISERPEMTLNGFGAKEGQNNKRKNQPKQTLNRREPMITKHYCKSIVRAALLLAVTMCIVGLAPAFSPSAQAYSINDVSGNYVDLGNGWTYGGKIGNDKQSVPWSVVGLVTFTPATGTFH